jgi:tetratricopeptide (TPR) repeat protein
MHIIHKAFVLLAVFGLNPALRAGLYYSGEQIAELPSQWRGFLLDQRALRNLAIKPNALTRPSPLRVRYEEALRKLEQASHERKLNADELADQGALYIRLGEPARALVLLRTAQHEHPNHFRIVANLGTAWQLQGDLAQAAACLQQAVRLAPGKLQMAEEYQLKLVQLRQREPRTAQDIDDLFGARFVGETGKFEPGKLAVAERKKLPSDAAAVVQQLALWLPADGRLLWLLAELANAHGDIRTAAAMMDGCVTEFGLHAPELRRHRQLLRDAADALAKDTQASGDSTKTAHTQHAGVFRPRSKRPLVSKLDTDKLPPVSLTGINALPWALLADTIVDRHFKPTFPKYLQELDGKQVSLTGFMQPLGEDVELGSFMLIEYPVGCWYCEMPEITGIVLVDLPPGKTTTLTREQVKITGRMALNAKDPENFLYTIKGATVSGAD